MRAEDSAAKSEVGSAPPDPNAGNKSEVVSATPEKANASDPFMDRLGIPAEVQAQLKEKEEVGSKKEEGEEQPAAADPDPDADPTPEADPNPSLDPDNDPEGVRDEALDPDPNDDPDAPASPFKDERVQQRINKEVRRRKREEQRADAAEAEVSRLQQEGQQTQQNRGSDAVPTLDNVRTERDLNQVVGRAQAVLDWCDANADGATTGEGDKQKFIEPNEIAKWRRDAERTMLKAEPTRTRIRDFSAKQQQYDTRAKEVYPELFPTQEQVKSGDVSDDYYLACALYQSGAQIFSAMPEANLLLGDIIAGKKAREAKAGASTNNGNGNGSNGRNGRGTEAPPTLRSADLPESIMRKRPPLAPVTTRPPSSHAAPNRAKKVEAAMNNLVADPDGGAASLSAALSAMGSREADANNWRAPVRV